MPNVAKKPQTATRKTARTAHDVAASQPEIAKTLRDHPFIHTSLVEICDLVSEAMAQAQKHESDEHLLDEINVAIWELRWKLRLHGGITTNEKREAAHG